MTARTALSAIPLVLAFGVLPQLACGDSDSSTNQPPVNAGGAGGDSEDAGGSGGEVGTDGGDGGGVKDSAKDGAPPAWDAPVGDTDIPVEEAKAVIELYALDLWAQALPASEAKLSVKLDGKELAYAGWPVAVIPVTKAGAYEISLSAPEHEPLAVTVDYDGTGSLNGAALNAGASMAGQGLSFSHEMRKLGATSVPVHTAYLGLRHKWYSASGRPARRGNKVELLLDGEEAWSRVYQDLQKATQSILVATWWWQSDFELVRDPTTHIELSESERWANTILGVLESRPGSKRVLVGQFWGQDSILSFLNTDTKIKAYADALNDGFEFLGQANETQGAFTFKVDPFSFGERVRASWQESQDRSFASEEPIQSTVPPHDVDLSEMPFGVSPEMASYHQKFAVVDDEVAFVGGMNVKSTDWDTSDHKVFEYRRMEYGASQADREAVKNKEKLPDRGPRKDYMVRIQGPAAQDVADVFQIRWQYLLDSHVEYSEKSTPFAVKRDLAAQPSGIQMQVTPTLPLPFWEHAIAETWFNAVRNAERYIYIEDQYFRMPMVNDAILARMQQVSTLRLVVITKPINEWTDLGCVWTYKSHAQFKNAFPDRYRLYQFRAFDTVTTWGVDETESRFQDVDTHAKILIVDDKFLSVGSCNKNNRGLVYEGELNVAVVNEAWVKAARRRIFTNFLPSGTAATDDVSVWWKQFQDAATANDTVYSNWEAEGGDLNLDGAPLPAEYQPKGMLYSMDFPDSSECNFESVGPDMTFH